MKLYFDQSVDLVLFRCWSGSSQCLMPKMTMMGKSSRLPHRVQAGPRSPAFGRWVPLVPAGHGAAVPWSLAGYMAPLGEKSCSGPSVSA